MVYQLFSLPIGLDNNSIIKAVGSGLVRISMTVDEKSRLFELQDVYYIPDMGTNNLLSVTYMVWKGYTVNFREKCEISKAGSIIGIAKNKKRLWVLDRNSVVPDPQVAHVAKISLNIWHKQLGHAMTCSVLKLWDLLMVTGIEMMCKTLAKMT